MKFIAHRINTIEELKKLPEEFGVELDLRDFDNRLILQHDPFVDGLDFEEYLKHYKHGLIILNIKSERIEFRVLDLLKQYGIKEYFFLDSSFPMIHLLAKEGEKNIALRFSEFEGMDTLRNMQGKVSWVWVDCFTQLPLNKEIYQELKAMKYKLCLVSPELQGRTEDLSKYYDEIVQEAYSFDAVCSKSYNRNLWLFD